MKNRKFMTLVGTIILSLVMLVGCNSNSQNASKGEEKNITITVSADSKEYKKDYDEKTELKTLGELLDKMGIIKTDDLNNARFVISVDNVAANSENKEWWNVKVNGENATAGIDGIKLKDGDKIELILTIGW